MNHPESFEKRYLQVTENAKIRSFLVFCVPERTTVTRKYDFVKQNENNFVTQYCFDTDVEFYRFIES